MSMRSSQLTYATGHEAELLVHRIRGEFLEMPGLRLTLQQASRLWHLDAATCTSALMRLVGDRFLERTASGAYVRADRA